MATSMIFVFLLVMAGLTSSSQTFQVLGVKHAWASPGEYFNFAAHHADAYFGRSDWSGEVVSVYVHRLKKPVEVRMWRTRSRDADAGTMGNAHGRVEPSGSKRPSDWRAGDVLTLLRGDTRVTDNSHPRGGHKGQYFQFDGRSVTAALGRANWMNEVFMLYNYRSKQTVEVILWGPRVPHGRVEPSARKRSSDWQDGDRFALLDGFEVKSIDHRHAPNGEYFNFMNGKVDKILGRTDWSGDKFMVYNERLSRTKEVVIWNTANGGSIGDGHGRVEPHSSKRSTDWRPTDVLTILRPAAATFSATYSHSIGNEAFYYAWGAYCDQSIIQSWHRGLGNGPHQVRLFQIYKVITARNGNLQAYIGYDHAHSRILMSFRGTANIDNWLKTNIRTIGPTRYQHDVDAADAKVHPGFYDAYKLLQAAGLYDAIMDLVEMYPGSDVLSTGHSLGGALCVIAALELKVAPVYEGLDIRNVGVVSFGMPRVFSPSLAEVFNNVIYSHWRIVNRYDIVTTIPPKTLGYYHVGTEIWYNHQRFWKDMRPLSFIVCNGPAEDPNCFGTTPWPSRLPVVSHHTNYFELDSGSMCRASIVGAGQSNENIDGDDAGKYKDIVLPPIDHFDDASYSIFESKQFGIWLILIGSIPLLFCVAFNLWKCANAFAKDERYAKVDEFLGSDEEEVDNEEEVI